MRCPTVDELCPPPSGRKGWPWTEGSAPLPSTTPNGAQWPKVSIVTPSYNQGLFLEETIRSLLLQGYPDLEYIIIDGGSTDGSVEIIKKYQKWLTSWVSEPDRGQAHAINKGFRKATGEILAWLNSDDTYEPDAIASAVTEMLNHRLDMVYGNASIVDECGNETSEMAPPDFELEHLLFNCFIPQQSTFFRRSVIESVGPINEDFHYAMDYDLWLRIASRFSVGRADGRWANYRICGGTKSFVQPEKFWPEIALALERFYLQPNLPNEAVALRAPALCHANLYAACEYYGRKRIDLGRQFLERAFHANPSLATKPEQAVRVLTHCASLSRPEAVVGFVNQVFENLPPCASQLGSLRKQVFHRGQLLSFNRYEPTAARSWIIANLNELGRDWQWLFQKPVFGILLSLLGGELVSRLANLRRRVYRASARIAQ